MSRPQPAPLLSIRDLHVRAGGREILRGVDLELAAGQVHAVMGPNGSGKSTLAHVIAGRGGYQVTRGQVLYEGRDLLALAPEERARAGVFLGLQYPVELPGVSTLTFLREAVNGIRRARGEPELDAVAFLGEVRARAAALGLAPELLKRNVNEGFSGGEKKRNEILQLALLAPRLAVLDETDSGLDIDALRVVAGGIDALRDPGRAFLLITHYQRLLDYVQPDRVHVLLGGRIVRSGGPALARELEEKGYGWLGGGEAA